MEVYDGLKLLEIGSFFFHRTESMYVYDIAEFEI